MPEELTQGQQRHGASGPRAAHVAILLGTLDGAAFLPQQLDSIQEQSHRDWSIEASDDGSKDSTLDVLASYRRRWGDARLQVRRGPAHGFCANFLSLVCAVDIQADYFAYCDQDDLWEPDKLERAVRWLSNQPKDTPALYCGRTRLVDVHGETIGFSPLFTRPVGIRNALVQSVAGGNTMMINGAARTLLVEAGPDIDVQTHDWWTYLVVAACGGVIHYDSHCSVAYRQHAANLVGSNIFMRGRVRRAARLLAGHFREMNERNMTALSRLRHKMDKDCKETVDCFALARRSGTLGRIKGVLSAGVYCQTPLANLGLAVATILNRL